MLGENSKESEAAAQDAEKAKKDAELYENRGPTKIIRLITVMAYMFSVSFVGMALSTYYIFLWEPPDPRYMHNSHSHLKADPQAESLVIDRSDYQKLIHPDELPIHLSSQLSNEIFVDEDFLGGKKSDDHDGVKRVQVGLSESSTMRILRAVKGGQLSQDDSAFSRTTVAPKGIFFIR